MTAPLIKNDRLFKKPRNHFSLNFFIPNKQIPILLLLLPPMICLGIFGFLSGIQRESLVTGVFFYVFPSIVYIVFLVIKFLSVS